MEIQPIDKTASIGKVKSIISPDQVNMTNQTKFVDHCVALLHEMPEVRPEILATQPAAVDPKNIADAMMNSWFE